MNGVAPGEAQVSFGKLSCAEHNNNTEKLVSLLGSINKFTFFIITAYNKQLSRTFHVFISISRVLSCFKKHLLTCEQDDINVNSLWRLDPNRAIIHLKGELQP